MSDELPIGEFHLGIDFHGDKHVEIQTESDSYALTESQVDEMCDVCEIDSIYGVFAHKLKVLEYLRSNGR